MTDKELYQALCESQNRRNGYKLHAWTVRMKGGHVHLVRWSKEKNDYVIACEPSFYLGIAVIAMALRLMPNCVTCIVEHG